MKFQLRLIRKVKSLFLKWNLHILIEPFSNMLLNWIYLSKLSKWRKQHPNIPFNDFYAPKRIYAKRYDLYKYLIKNEKLTEEINYLEFGVAKGLSFEWWTKENQNPQSRFFGFDTFTGLPEDWNMLKKGSMSADGTAPKLEDTRSKFIKGLFQKTFPDFLKNFNNDKRNVLLLDADLYSSTLYVLTQFAPYLKENDILIFDEFSVPQHEFLAFTNFIQAYKMNYEVLAAVNNYYCVSVKVLGF